MRELSVPSMRQLGMDSSADGNIHAGGDVGTAGVMGGLHHGEWPAQEASRRGRWPGPRQVASSPLRIAGASRLEAADLLTADLFLLQSRRFVANIKLVGGQEASSSRSPTSPAEGFGASATPRRQGTTLLCVALSATSSMPHPTLLFSRRQQPRSSTTTSRHNQLQHPYDSMVRYHKQITYH